MRGERAWRRRWSPVVVAMSCAAVSACLPGGSDGADEATEERIRPPTAEELDGVWLTGEGEEAAILTINDGLVYFTENQNGEGDTCEGTVENGRVRLESCERNGEQVFADRMAHVVFLGDELRLTWVSGEQETYAPMLDQTAGH